MTARELLRAVASILEHGEAMGIDSVPSDGLELYAKDLRALADRIDQLDPDKGGAFTDACATADPTADNIDAVLRVVLSRLDAPLDPK